MKPRSALFLLAATAVASCQSTPRGWDDETLLAPFELGEEFEVTYFGELSGKTLPPLQTEFEPPAIDEGQPLPAMIEVKTRIVSMPTAIARRLLPDFPVTAGRGATLSAEGLGERLGDLVGHGIAQEINSPTLTCYDGQLASIAVLNQLSYIEGFEFERAEMAMIADPHIGVAEDGLLMTLRPSVDDAHRTVHVDLHLELRELMRPIPVSTLELFEDGPPLSLQIPIFNRQQLSTDILLQENQAAVIGSFQSGRLDEVVLVFVSARPIAVHRDESVPGDAGKASQVRVGHAP